MTDKERIEALLDRKKPDRVPIWPFLAGGFSVVHTKSSIADAYNNPRVALAAQEQTCRDFGWVFAPQIAYASFGAWEFGGDIKWPKSEFDQAPIVTRPPIQKEEDVWKLKKPDIATAGIIPLMKDLNMMATNEEHDNKPFRVFAYVGGVFSRACNIAGIERFCKWLIKKPEAAHHLLGIVTDFSVELAHYWKEQFGTERVLLMAASEASTDNNLVSSRHFENFAYPYLKESADKILGMGYKHIYSHICGEQNANLPFWQQVNFGDPGIISIGHEIELEKAAEHFTKHIIMGNLEPALIQFSKPDEIYEATRYIIEVGKRLPCGYIFSPGCELPPRADSANVMAMTKAVNDYGWYD